MRGRLCMADVPEALEGMEFRRLLVVFEDGDHCRHWSRPFLKSGFAHCWAAFHDGDAWFMLNPSNPYTQITRMPTEQFEEFACAKTAMIFVESERNYVRYPIMTCVEFIRGLLGISRPIFTPYQLYRYLMYGRVSKEDLGVGRTTRAVSSGRESSQTSGG